MTAADCYSLIVPSLKLNSPTLGGCSRTTALQAKKDNHYDNINRRKAISSLSFLSSAALFPALSSQAEEIGGMDVNDFLKTGMVSQPMGVSGQAGKSRPELGINIRDGSEVSRNKSTGSVLAEIVLKPKDKQPAAVLTSFTSPWPLAKSSMFGIECRDGSTGDSAFIAVSDNTAQSTIKDVPNKYIIDQLFNSATGRFSSYGAPTDIRLKKSTLNEDENYKLLEVTFSTLSQSTQTEIPRTALISATIPNGLDQVVMLVSSATTVRYKKGKGVMDAVQDSAMSFRASPSPKSNLKVRIKEEYYN